MKHRIAVPLVLLPLVGLSLSGCVSEKESMVREGYPAAYADGFEDGCHSGAQAGGSYFDQFKKDVRRFGTDKEYAQGWSDGFRQCETKQEAMERQIRQSMEWQRMEQERKDRMAHEALKGLDTRGLDKLK